MGKALFFDVDGTLIDFHGNMPDSTAYALEHAEKKGHQIIICSGRADFQMKDELFHKFHGVIGCTGANVTFRGETVYEHFMSPEDLLKVIEVLNAASARIVLMSENNAIMKQDCYEYLKERFFTIYEGGDKVPPMLESPLIVDEWSGYTYIKKILYHDSVWNIQKIAEALKSICDVTASSFEKEEADSGEITCRGINKSLGMRKYIEHCNIPWKDTIAFGDGPNDVDMIEYAHIGVAMGNGRKELKDKADFITKDVTEDGIYYAMKTLGLID